MIVETDGDDPDCACVYVDGNVAGRPYRFLLDTGAARSQIVADSFISGLDRDGTHTSRAAFGGSQDASLVRLPDLAIGPVDIGPLRASMVPPEQPGAQNLIGMDVLGSLRCEFSFSTGELLVGGSTSQRDWLSLHLDAGAHAYLDVEWPCIRGDAVWDTGAGITVVDEGFYRRWPELFAPCGTSVGTDATGVERVAEMALVAMPLIGGAAFPSHKVVVVDLEAVNATLDRPMDFILGYTTLCLADWLFDFPAQRWSLSNVADGSESSEILLG